MWKLIAVVHSCGIWPKFLSSQCLSPGSGKPPSQRHAHLFRQTPAFRFSVVVWALKSWKQCEFSSRVCRRLGPSLLLLLGRVFFFSARCIIKKVLYFFCRFGVGVYLHLAVGCVKRLALLGKFWESRGKLAGKTSRTNDGQKILLLLVLKFLILCYLVVQTIWCQWEYEFSLYFSHAIIFFFFFLVFWAVEL